MSTITHAFGDMDTSQSVKAYRASMVLSGDTSFGRWMTMFTFPAVRSSIFLILIFPFSFAFRMESMTICVVFPNGISVMAMVFLSSFSIRARTLTVPPRLPLLYLEQSA